MINPGNLLKGLAAKCGFAALVVTAFSASLAHGQQTLTCSSDNGNRQYCGADTRGGVTLAKQRSGSPCIQGRTWGYDKRGVWVDRGCRADFIVGSSNGYRPGGGYRPGNGYPGSGRPGYGPGNGRPGYGPGGQPYIQNLTCSSDNGKRNWCAVQRNGDVRMVRQRSGSRCTRDYSWGVQPGSVWVDHGCRADFEIRASR
jgi:hypothetical protein